MFHNKFQYSTVRHATILTVREGEDDGNNGNQGSGNTGDDIEARIQAAVAAATQGLKTKNEELLGKLAANKERMKSFEGLDPEKIKALQERLDQDEDAKLLAEGKKNVVIEKYTERMRAAHAQEIEQWKAKVAEADQRADAYKGSVLDNQIRSVLNGLHKGAVEDALLHARQIFQLDAKGNAVKLDSEGRPELGKDGKSPFSPAEWIELQKELKPHWFPMDTSGSGSGPAREAGGTGKTIKRADFEKLSPHDQGTVARNGTKIVD